MNTSIVRKSLLLAQHVLNKVSFIAPLLARVVVGYAFYLTGKREAGKSGRRDEFLHLTGHSLTTRTRGLHRRPGILRRYSADRRTLYSSAMRAAERESRFPTDRPIEVAARRQRHVLFLMP